MVVGDDRTVTIAKPPPPPAPGIASVGRVTVKGTTATVPVSCRGATSCQVSLRLTIHETLLGHRIVAVTAAKTNKKPKRRHRLVVLGTKKATVGAGRTAKLKVSLNRAGRRLLTARHRLAATLTVSQRRNRKTAVVARRKLTFASRQKRKRKRHH